MKGYSRYASALFAKGNVQGAIDAYKTGLSHDATDKLCKDGLAVCEAHMATIATQKAEEAKWAVEVERQKKVIADRDMAAFVASKDAKDSKSAPAAAAAGAAPAGKTDAAEDAKHAAQLTGKGYDNAKRSDAEYQEFMKWKQSKRVRRVHGGCDFGR